MTRPRARLFRPLAVGLGLGLGLGLASIASAQALVAVPTPQLGGQCDDLDPSLLAAAIERELPAIRKLPSIQIGPTRLTGAQYAEGTLTPLLALAQAQEKSGGAALCNGLRERFQFFRNPGSSPGKFTAYHNPIFRGSRAKTAAYRFPLYRRPAGALAKLTTAEILAGALEGKGLELAWLADATDALAAHVEGSASIELDDGTVMNVGSDGHNGHPYQNVSKLVAAAGVIPAGQPTPIGMTRARKFLVNHPDQVNTFWGKNPHFVFFKGSDKRGGGRFGELVAGRSLAVDVAHVPMGAACWIRTDKPAIDDNAVAAWVSYGRVALAQDTGAGIIGPGRVDVFFGTGPYAEQASAVTTRPGELYVLLAK